MPKRRILRSRRVGLSNTKSVMAKTVVVPFTDITTIQRTASLGYEISEIELKIASFGASSRVRVMAGLYEYFRFRKLSVEAITDTAMATVVVVADAKQYFPGYAHGLGFEPSAAADFTAVTSFDDLMQLPKSTMGPCHQRLRLSLSRANMQGSNPVKWFHTATTGTPPVADSVAGTLTYVSRTPAACSSQGTYSYIIIRGEVEFTAPLASGAAELTQPPIMNIGSLQKNASVQVSRIYA